MLYRSYQWQDDMVAPIRAWARLAKPLLQPSTWGLSDEMFPISGPLRRRVSASLEMVARSELSHCRPDFDITSVIVDDVETTVVEEIALRLPFGNLVHFRKEFGADVVQPKVLVVAAMSGHFATLLRDTVDALLVDHDVYITDWINVRDVPLADGRFGMDEYISYVISFLEEIGPQTHVVAVCQPCVQALAAVAVMAEDDNPATPASLTLMAGPIDVRQNPTGVNDLATERSLEWFERNVIHTVPRRYAGGGRRVYPGFVQLTAFMSMNPDRHMDQHLLLYDHLVAEEHEAAEVIKDFYDEYFSVSDLAAEFYLETIDYVFQRALLATGDLTYRGRRVDPGAIRSTPLLTVEGERDDICSVGQTAAAHDLCSSLPTGAKRHHLQAGVGHYGVFSGARWRNEICPEVANFVLLAQNVAV